MESEISSLSSKLQALMNITDSSGNPITFFDGKITLSQLIVGIVGLVIIFFALKIARGLARGVSIAVTVIAMLIHFGIASPTQLTDTAKLISEKGINSYQEFVKASDNIRVSGSKLEVKINGKWIDVTSISSIVQGDDAHAQIVVNGEKVDIDDVNIISLLQSFK